MKNTLSVIFEMGKVRISLPISLSAFTGYLMYAHQSTPQAWSMALGVFLIACGSGALNHWQEWKTDALMPRTMGRPIPSGKISPATGLVIAVSYVLAGSLVLVLTNPPVALVISWLTLIFYNLVYTPLKKITAFAVIPGSFVGALPPMIGWSAAGGNIFSEPIILVSIFFFIGQIPHFWLLLLMFGDQYKQAQMPSLNLIFSQEQINRITYIWILTSVSSAYLVLFRVLEAKPIQYLLLFYILFLLFSFSIWIFIRKELKVKSTFFRLNLLYLLMMAALIWDSLN